jgi:hypothetical protein
MPQRPPFVRCRVLDEPVDLATFMILREVLRDGKAILTDEQEAVAVLIGLHLIAGADPASFFGLLGLIGIEIAWTEGFPKLVLMQR